MIQQARGRLVDDIEQTAPAVAEVVLEAPLHANRQAFAPDDGVAEHQYAHDIAPAILQFLEGTIEMFQISTQEEMVLDFGVVARCSPRRSMG